MDAPRTKSCSRLAANLSWVCPIITIMIFALLIFSRQIVPRKIIALVASGALCLIAVGLIFGIVALFGISKQGTKGILAPAIVGIIINGLLLSFVVANFMAARFRAIQQHGGIETPPVVAMWSTRALQRRWNNSHAAPLSGCCPAGQSDSSDNVMPQSCPARKLVAQDSILPYRGFPICEPSAAPALLGVCPICRMEFGDTADWKICATAGHD